jgi:hypothetical protein
MLFMVRMYHYLQIASKMLMTESCFWSAMLLVIFKVSPAPRFILKKIGMPAPIRARNLGLSQGKPA